MNKRMENKLLNSLNIKKKEQGGGSKPKLSPMSEKYRLYLQQGGKKTKSSFKKAIIPKKNEPNKNEPNKNEPKKDEPKKDEPKKDEPKKDEPKKDEPKQGKMIQLERKPSKSKDNPKIKIIHQKEKKSKHKYTRKKPSKIKNIKDINDIEKKIEQSKRAAKTKSDIKRSLVKQVKRNMKRNDLKHNSKRNKKGSKGSKGSRKVKIKKHKRVSEKDIQTMQKHIESIRSKKTEEIKQELEKEGIQVSGKSKRLLKDIYLYSKVCGINIRHEK